MSTLRTASFLILCATLVPACSDVEMRQTRSSVTVEITSPRSEVLLSAGTVVSFSATARTQDGLATLALMAGTRELRSCPGAGATELPCSVEFDPGDILDQAERGMVKLTAHGNDAMGTSYAKTIVVYVKGIVGNPDGGEPDAGEPDGGEPDGGEPDAGTPDAGEPAMLRFLQPAVGGDGVAAVSATSPLELGVTSPHGITRIDVTFDGARPLRSFTATPYSSPIAWAQELGTGQHRLVARATDAAGGTLEAVLDLRFFCASDAECGSGFRCCSEKGTCNPIVGSGANCDCEHPCPGAEGCFPGTCGQTPRRCRPGCFPGDANRWADRCPLQDGRTAYCSKLPEIERTAQNKGGACAPADVCDTLRQDCPDLPLDRTRPVAGDNPAVPHNCVPVSPVANACIPAGGVLINQSGCSKEDCGLEVVRLGCVKGGLCVTPLGPDLQPRGAAYCAKECSSRGATNECPYPQSCGSLVGAGYEPYPTGACGG